MRPATLLRPPESGPAEGEHAAHQRRGRVAVLISALEADLDLGDAPRQRGEARGSDVLAHEARAPLAGGDRALDRVHPRGEQAGPVVEVGDTVREATTVASCRKACPRDPSTSRTPSTSPATRSSSVSASTIQARIG